jgi:hypothetical protein
MFIRIGPAGRYMVTHVIFEGCIRESGRVSCGSAGLAGS